MKIELLVIGKNANAHLQHCIDDYMQRLSHYVPFKISYISDIKNVRNLTQEQQKQAEGKAILAQLDAADRVVLLDEHGKIYRSIEFAHYISQKMISVPKRLVFIVGGPYGFSQEVYSRADEKISLSPMTFSHEMIRLIFTEQLYRAFTIIRGEPYHHE